MKLPASVLINHRGHKAHKESLRIHTSCDFVSFVVDEFRRPLTTAPILLPLHAFTHVYIAKSQTDSLSRIRERSKIEVTQSCRQLASQPRPGCNVATAFRV